MCVCVCGTAAGESHKCLLAIARRWRRRCVKYRAAPRTRDQYAPKTRARSVSFFSIVITIITEYLKKKNDYSSSSLHIPTTTSLPCADVHNIIIITSVWLRMFLSADKMDFSGSNTKKEEW